MPDYELRIRVTAPTPADGERWAGGIRDLVVAEFGETMRLDIDGPRLVNPPGSTVEQLPDDVLAGQPEHRYVSTACVHGLHRDRCRSNCKFCGALCACRCHAVGVKSSLVESADPALCGLPHYDYPESLCAEPAGHDEPERPSPHAAVLVIGGKECGAVAWGPEVTR